MKSFCFRQSRISCLKNLNFRLLSGHPLSILSSCSISQSKFIILISISKCVFQILTRPSAANKNFPYHVRTTQIGFIDDTANPNFERSAYKPETEEIELARRMNTLFSAHVSFFLIFISEISRRYRYSPRLILLTTRITSDCLMVMEFKTTR